MSFYYSPSADGFFMSGVCEIPSDAIQITDDEHQQLSSGRNSGKLITLAGGIPTLTDPPPPTQEQIIARMESLVQLHLDSVVGVRGYDSIYTACSYADEPSVEKFQAEGFAHGEGDIIPIGRVIFFSDRREYIVTGKQIGRAHV